MMTMNHLMIKQAYINNRQIRYNSTFFIRAISCFYKIVKKLFEFYKNFHSQ